MLFKDRHQAGILLANKLRQYQSQSVLILGLARGGVVTAAAVAVTLGLSVDVLVVKKLTGPYHHEFALGAVAPDHVCVIHWRDVQRMGLDEVYIKNKIERLSKNIRTQSALYRRGKKPMVLEGKTVMLVDDGTATGATMEVAVRWARKKKAKKIVVGLPVASTEAVSLLQPEADAMIVYSMEDALTSIGAYYTSFAQVSDNEVIKLVQQPLI